MTSGSEARPGEVVDTHDVLERVAALPITTWSYLWDEGRVRHMGPMAQDFHAAFGLGGDERRIDVADGLGVALAAIQALHELVEGQAAEIAELHGRLDRLIRAAGDA
jgi:hypothetical protein